VTHTVASRRIRHAASEEDTPYDKRANLSYFVAPDALGEVPTSSRVDRPRTSAAALPEGPGSPG
jgi:hypothetical protein